ncbi:DUF58 domain-containing protein [Paenibacillus sp. 598K]|uniref:DUF58 domain-containing protein n=1 Tax=Paenibacillus sp. 598K TaxID=1117987 RepID=UPI000FFA712C|nr:DUF58 domain-containing protein [Paenibacillus sp. 598K]GBF73717.1 DUF58 domain-containing protein [Paenibacillus sp. 598K]
MDILKAKGSRWWLVASLYVSCALYLLFQGGKTSFMLFMIVNVLLLYLILGRWSGVARVHGTRKLQHKGGGESLPAGSRLEVQLQLRVPGVWPIPYVMVRERLIREGHGEMPFEIPFVPDIRRSGEISYLTPPLSRGHYRFAPTVCSTWDIFGLFEHNGQFHSTGDFRVLPQTIDIRYWRQLNRGMKGPFSHAASSRSAKETTQLNGVREYHHGDRLSRVHWNATAKTGQWKSKEFEREALPRTVVVLDRHVEAYAQPDRFELAVSVAASLFEHGLRRETAMGLVSVGESAEGYVPRATPAQRKSVMSHLVGVAADSPLPLYAALKQAGSLLSPGSFAVVITPQGGEETIKTMQWLERTGLVPCLIHIADDEGPLLSQDEPWQRLIRSRGWPFYAVRHLQELPGKLEGGGASAIGS